MKEILVWPESITKNKINVTRILIYINLNILLILLTLWLFCLGIFCYANNHPVIRAEVLGRIVSIDEKEKLTSYGGIFIYDLPSF